MSAKPRRIRFRHVVLFLVVGYLSYLGVRAYQLLTLTSGNSVDFAQQMLDRVAAAQPKGENAWPEYAALHEAHMALMEEIRKEAPEHSKYPHPLYDDVYTPLREPEPSGDAVTDAENLALARKDHDLAREWAGVTLDRFAARGIDGRLDALVAARTMVRPKTDQTPMLGMLMEDLGRSRNLARALKARMHIARQRGDQAAVVADLGRVLALARHIGRQGTLIERLVSLAMIALAMEEAREQLKVSDLSPETCRAMLAVIDRQVDVQPLSFQFECERLCVLDTVQYLHSDDGDGDGTFIVTLGDQLGNKSSPRIVNLFGAFAPRKKSMVKAANELFDGFVAAADTPRRDDRTSVFDFDVYAAKLGPHYRMLSVLGPAYEKAMAGSDQSQMNVAGTRTLIAIELFRLENKRLPASLAELVPACLPELPDDPYAPNGKLRFRVLAQPDEHARTYIVYSVGADGADDAGVPARGAYDALKPGPPGAGFDFVINAPPEKK